MFFLPNLQPLTNHQGVDKIKPILAANVVLMILFSMAVCFTSEITTSKVRKKTFSVAVGNLENLFWPWFVTLRTYLGRGW